MQAFHDITVTKKSLDGNTGEYLVAPLPRGYGHTLGNALRRILLSSLEGTAITKIQFKDVKHEYSTIDGVKEDVLEIVLNLKNVRFKRLTDEGTEFTCKLNASGKGVVTAGDLEVPGQLEVTNPDQVIATLTSDKAKLIADLTVETGIGYKGDVQNKRDEIGLIPVDTDFTPIVEVSYDVQSARKGQKVDLDGVTFRITTDGSIAPVDALLQAATLLQDFAGKVMVGLGVSKEEVEAKAEESYVVERVEEEEDLASSEVGSWRVEDLPISKRSKSGLLSGGFNTVSDIAAATKEELMALQGFGNKSLNEVVDLMSQYGIEIK